MRTYINGTFYKSNLVLAPDNTPLSVIDDKRMEFYLRNNLAEKIEPYGEYDNVIKLNFEPKGGKDSPDIFRQILETRCFVCSSTETLSKHHVVPYCISKYFPLEEKAHKHFWVILLCEYHHNKIEESFRTLFQDEQHKFHIEYMKEFMSMVHSMYKLWSLKFKIKKIDYVPKDRIENILSKTKYWKTTEDIIENEEFYKALKEMELEKSNEAKEFFYKEFINKHGIEKIREMFRETVLNMKPLFLPEGFCEIKEQI